ncbi:hypothetical protein L6164_032996 [Bauhinia variegata]|uniref:Uncharacterized protein n=1 Tax=Bauhinia variegata TaxID=167791 RepID=A0ACB9KQL6_BAUVA|nr:hypothetical protein L6164_032996 [Bauhinia variegata]
MDVKVEIRSMEADDGLGWGSSLQVPSVQEMVRIDSQTVPERYIRESKDRPVIDGLCPISSEIPVIDFSLLANRDKEEQQKLHFASKEWGFFQIINHGVAEDLLHRMKAAAAAFFDLPLEEKMKYSMAEKDIQGYGQVFVVSENQKLDWNDLSFLMTYPPESRNLKYWPLTLLGFKETLEEYSTEISKFSEDILANLSLLMGMEENSLKDFHKVVRLGMRMNYYPPCSKPDLVLGLSPHSDGGTITVLLQDDDITGLQIKHQGEWIPVKPLHGAFVVNIGDAIEIWSNGTYKSVEHRAVTHATKARISVATFVTPHDEAEMGPVQPMLLNHPAMYRRIKCVDYARQYLNRELNGKHIDIVKLDDKS